MMINHLCPMQQNFTTCGLRLLSPLIILGLSITDTFSSHNFHSLSLTSVFASVVFEDCGSAYDLYAVNIDGCGMRLPCYVTLGEDVPVNLEFRADFESRKLDQNVVININHIDLKTNVTPELCDSVVCPVRTDGLTSFYSVMTVPVNIALNQRGYLRWRIYNERGVRVLCYSVLVQTQSYLQKLMRSQYNFIEHT